MMNKWGIFQIIYLESYNRASSVPLAPFDVAAGSVEGLKEGWKAPCCKLNKALYGHPEAGGHWEAHLHKAIVACGGIAVTNHPSCY